MLDELLTLGALFPRLRLRDPELERWLDDQGGGQPTRELLEEALARISDDERDAMARRYAGEYPEGVAQDRG